MLTIEPPPPGDQVRPGRAGHQEDQVELVADGERPVGEGQLVDRAEPDRRRVVDQHVEPAEPRRRLLDPGVRAPSSVDRSTGANASIRPPAPRTRSTVSCDRSGSRSQPTTWAPSRRAPQRRGAADPAGGPGDQDCLAVEPAHGPLHPPRLETSSLCGSNILRARVPGQERRGGQMAQERDLGVPPGFLWGAATAAHQVEGGNVGNDWWELEHAVPPAVAEPQRGRLRQLPPLSPRTSASSPASGSTRTGSAWSGAASSPSRASSPGPRSTTTGAWWTAA